MRNRAFCEDYIVHWTRPSFEEAKKLVHAGPGFMEAEAATFVNDYLLRHLSSGSVVMDFGCGIGRLTRPLAKKVSWVYAVDATASMLQFAAEYCISVKDKVSFLELRNCQIPINDNTIDLVVAQNVLHFIHPFDAQYLLSEICRTLRPGGTLVFNCFNFDSDSAVSAARVGTAIPKAYNRAMLSVLLRRAGFQISEISGDDILQIVAMADPVTKRNLLRPADVPYQAEISGKTILPIRLRLDDLTGYGQMSVELALGLTKLFPEYQLLLQTLHREFKNGEPAEVKALKYSDDLPGSWEMLLYTLVVGPHELNPRKDTVYFTMWESTRVDAAALNRLNSAALLLVPNSWFASIVSAHGINTPTRVVPLGIDLDSFPNTALPNGPFTIGTAGRFSSGGVRKGVDIVVDAFARAFPDEKDVRLRVKCAEDCPLPIISDSRIDVTPKILPTKELARWYQSLHVLASGSACEGWGRHQHEAMTSGRPVIGVNYGGVTEFWNPTNGYAVDFQLTPGRGVYEGLGHYAQPDVKSMAEQMRRAYEDRKELKEKSRLARASGSVFTIERMVRRVVEELKGNGFLS